MTRGQTADSPDVESAAAGFGVYVRVVVWGGFVLVAVLWLYAFVSSLRRAQAVQKLPEPPSGKTLSPEDLAALSPSAAERAARDAVPGAPRPGLSEPSQAGARHARSGWLGTRGAHFPYRPR